MANDLIASKIDDIQNDVNKVNPDYLIVDTPGQIEYAFWSFGCKVECCAQMQFFEFAHWQASEQGFAEFVMHEGAAFIELAGEINTSMPTYVVGRVAEALNDRGKPIHGSRISIPGIPFAMVRKSPPPSASLPLLS